MFILADIDKLSPDKGFFVGTTNQLFLTLPKLKADLIVDLDKETIKIDEKFKSLLKPT